MQEVTGSTPVFSTTEVEKAFPIVLGRLFHFSGVLKWKHEVISTSGHQRLFLIFIAMPLPYCVYILFSKKDFELYVGYTSNLEARIKNHNSGGTKSTSYRGPLELIFCEFYLFNEDARKRELYFKTTMGKKAIKLMMRTTLEKMGYKGALTTLTVGEDNSPD